MVLEFRGSAHFRHRVSCSILTGKSIKISDIRSDAETPGLEECEVSFLRLMEKLTNGTSIRINDTGTIIELKPGVLEGGRVSHSCPPSRAVSYFLEPLLFLSPFMKNNVQATLTGTTNSMEDISVDAIRTIHLPILKKFGIPEDGLDIRVSVISDPCRMQPKTSDV